MAVIQQINTRKHLVIAFPESTEGTDAIDAALEANSVIWYSNVAPPTWGKVRVPLPSNPARSHRQAPARQTIASHMNCRVNGAWTEWESGAAGKEAPTWRHYLLASGFTEAIVSATSATFTLDATSYAAGTPLSLWDLLGNAADTKHRLTYGVGGRGGFSAGAQAGGLVRWDWNGRFANYVPWSADAQYIQASDGTPLLGNDGAALANAYTGVDLFDPGKEMALITATASWNSGATSVPISGFSFNTGLQPVNRLGASATTIVENVYLDAPGPPTFTVKATESDSVLDAFLAAADADTVADFVITWETAACKVTVTFPFAQLDIPRMSSDANLAAWEYAFVASDDYNTAVPGADMTIAFEAP